MKIKNAFRVSSYIIIALVTFCLGYIYCLFNTTFTSIAMTPNITKAIEIQNFVENLDYKHSYVSIGHVDNKYILTPNFSSDEIKLFDDLTIMLAESDIVDDSVIIGFNYKYTNNKKLATKRIEKSIERRLKKVDSVMSVKASVKHENDEMFITVDVNVFESNKGKIEKIISRLVPVDKEHKTINVNYLK